MTDPSPSRPIRLSAEERYEQIVEAAVAEFADGGLEGTTTQAIARRAGISQPYVFRFFPTKRALFLAACERCFDRIRLTWEAAADHVEGDDPGHRLGAMGMAYGDLLSDRRLLLLQLQAFAACDDDEIRAVVRRRYRELMAFVRDTSGVDTETVNLFFAHGMLLNVAAVLELSEIPLAPAWALALPE